MAVEALESRMLLTAPSVASINLVGVATTNSTTVSWTATFSDPVTGVDPTDFSSVKTGTIGAALTRVVPVSASVYTVTVSGITGSGTLGLNLIDNDSITDLSLVPLGETGLGNGDFSGQIATLDRIAPSVQTINRSNPASATTNASSVSFTATFSEPVTGVDPGDFKLADVGTVTGTVSLVTALSSSEYTVTVSGITGDGTLGLNLVDDGSIHDVAGNHLVTPGSQVSFAKEASFPVGFQPNWVAVGDVNGDGSPDLVAAIGFDHEVSVVLGNGNGTFQSQQTFATDSTGEGIALSDLNGDGKLDVIVPIDPFSISVFLGNGDGTFQTEQTFESGPNPRNVVVFDVNGDGNPDIITDDVFPGIVNILLGNGDGTFQTRRTFAVGKYTASVAVGDVNGDGAPDLVASNTKYNNISVLLGNGDGTFQTSQTFAAAGNPLAANLADLNGDGKLDVVVTFSTSAIGVLLGTGGGTFPAEQTYAVGSDPEYLTVGDVNGDGQPDLIALNALSQSASVLLGNGDGTFQADQTFAAGSGLASVNLVDVNGDTKPDIVVVDSTSSKLGVLLANGNGDFTGQSYTVVAPPTVINPTSASITSTTARLGADISDDGSDALLQVGVLYALTSDNATFAVGDPSVANVLVSGSLAKGVFTVNASGLVPGANYSFVAYATNSQGTTYTSVASFKTAADHAPTVATAASATSGPVIATSTSLWVLGADVDTGESSLTYTWSIIGTPPSPVTFTDNGTNTAKSTTARFSAIGTYHFQVTITDPSHATVTSTVDQTVDPADTRVESLMSGSTVVEVKGKLTSPIDSLDVVFSFGMNASESGVNSVLRKSNWQLEKYAADYSNLISGITYDAKSRTATVHFSESLPSGGYQLIAKSSLHDVLSQPILGFQNGAPSQDYIRNFFVADSVDGQVDVAPLLYGVAAQSDALIGPLATPVAPTLRVFDGDSPTFNSATIQFASGYQNGEDILGFVNTRNITGSWDPSSGTLTLTGTDGLSAYRAAIRSVTYLNVSDTPNTSITRSLNITVNDGSLPSNSVIRNFTVRADSGNPSLTGLGGTTTFNEGPTAIAPSIGLTHPDGLKIASATVSFANWQVGDRVSFTNSSALQHTFAEDLTAHTALLTLTGDATAARYQIELSSVKFTSVVAKPDPVSRTATFTVTDVLSNTATGSQTILIEHINQSPELSGVDPTPVLYRANHPEDAALLFLPSLGLSDADSTTLSGATVQISTGYQNNVNEHDLLSIVNRFGITGSFDATSGTLTLSGSSSVSNYRTELRTIGFSTSGAVISTETRTVAITVTDETSLSSNLVMSNIAVSTANASPVLSGFSGTRAYLSGSQPILIASGLIADDVDSTQLVSATMSFTNWHAGDRLSFSNTFALQHSFIEDTAAGTATLTLSGWASIQAYQSALKTIGFYTVAGAPVATPRTVTIVVNDGFTDSNPVTGAITVTS